MRTRAAERGDVKAPRDNQAALFGVLAALAISLLAIVARIVSDAAAAALEGVAEVRDTLAQPRVYIAIVGLRVAAASIYKRVHTLIESALAEDLLEAAVAALARGGCRVGARRAVRPPRDAPCARWPLAGAKRRARQKSAGDRGQGADTRAPQENVRRWKGHTVQAYGGRCRRKPPWACPAIAGLSPNPTAFCLQPHAPPPREQPDQDNDGAFDAP